MIRRVEEEKISISTRFDMINDATAITKGEPLKFGLLPKKDYKGPLTRP